jgi:hypothetical protein
MSRIERDGLIYIALVLGSLIFLVWVIPAYSPPYPGYGARASLVPNVAVSIILVLSALALVRIASAYFLGKGLGPEESEYPAEGRSDGFSQIGRMDVWHLIRFALACGLFVPAMVWIGYVPAAIIFMLVIQYLCGRREIVPAAATALVMVFLLYVAMRYGLGVTLPGA